MTSVILDRDTQPTVKQENRTAARNLFLPTLCFETILQSASFDSLAKLYVY